MTIALATILTLGALHAAANVVYEGWAIFYKLGSKDGGLAMTGDQSWKTDVIEFRRMMIRRLYCVTWWSSAQQAVIMSAVALWLWGLV